MRTSNTFGIHFVLRENRGKNGLSAIYMRIVVNKSRSEIALKRHVSAADWSDAKGMAKPKNDELRKLNTHLEQLRRMMASQYQELQLQKKVITAEVLKNLFSGVKDSEHTLHNIVEYHNTNMRDVLAPGTMKNYYTTAIYLKEFVQQQFRRSDIYLSELDYSFITKFEYFLRKRIPGDHQKKLENNGLMKHLERFRKIIRLAVKMAWLEKDPFAMFQLKFEKTERGFLTIAELKKIENKKLTIERIAYVRDLFVLSCYTGLAYIDVMELTEDNLVQGIDNMPWVKTTREKTRIPVNVPLLPEAAKIIERYKGHPKAVAGGTLLPHISNQKLNSYLKEVADLCDIQKTLTYHVARHTFATAVTLSNGVPIETVSKMLGHTTIRTTQIYAKVVERKVSDDMNMLREKLASPSDRTCDGRSTSKAKIKKAS
jgi:site-specific recombinase XerD